MPSDLFWVLPDAQQRHNMCSAHQLFYETPHRKLVTHNFQSGIPIINYPMYDALVKTYRRIKPRKNTKYVSISDQQIPLRQICNSDVKIVPRRNEIGLEPYCLLEVCQRFDVSFHLVERDAEIVVSFDIIALERDCLVIAGNCVTVPIELFKRIAAIIVGRGIGRLQRDRSIIAGDRGIWTVEPFKRIAKNFMSRRRFVVDCECLQK